jgi:hypothetical protein
VKRGGHSPLCAPYGCFREVIVTTTNVGFWPDWSLPGVLQDRLGRAPLPGLEIRHEHPLQVISKRHTDAQHCLKVVPPGTGYKLALVGGMGDLVQVAADAPKLADGALDKADSLSCSRSANACSRAFVSDDTRATRVRSRF